MFCEIVLGSFTSKPTANQGLSEGREKAIFGISLSLLTYNFDKLKLQVYASQESSLFNYLVIS